MAESTEAAEAAPKKKSKLPMIIIAAVLLIGAGVGAYLMLKPAKTEEEKAKAAAESVEPGEIVKLEPVTINLADGHYLKMSFALQATADVAEAPDGSKALDLAITEYTDRKIAELSTAAGRAAVKKEFTEKIKKAYMEEEKETVMDLYITSFVTQ